MEADRSVSSGSYVQSGRAGRYDFSELGGAYGSRKKALVRVF